MNKKRFYTWVLLFILLISSFYLYSCYVHHLYMNQQYAVISRLSNNEYLAYFKDATPQEIIRGKQIASMHSDYSSLNDLLSNYITTPILPFICFIGAIGCLIFLFVSEQKDKERKYILNQLEKIENNHYEVSRSTELIDDKINQFYSYIQTVKKEGQLTKDNSRKFIEDVAHQIKTPLTVVKLYTENSTDQYASECIDNINRMELMLENLIHLSKLEAHSIQYNMNYNSILDSIETVVEGIDYLIKEKYINLQLEVEDLYFYYDDLWLSEAITNILKNSIEYSFEGGIIKFSVKSFTNHILIQITDYGQAISDEVLPHLFDRFYSTKGNDRKQNGMGIGLNIAKEVVLAHKGLIYVNNRNGITFTIDLPNIQLKEKI